jgi:hypothetical protein
MSNFLRRSSKSSDSIETPTIQILRLNSHVINHNLPCHLDVSLIRCQVVEVLSHRCWCHYVAAVLAMCHFNRRHVAAVLVMQVGNVLT